MAGNPPWAPEEDQRLRALALSGASVAEMAKPRAIRIVLSLMLCLASNVAQANCSDAIDTINSAISNLSNALQGYSRCLSDSNGRDDCSSEFRSLTKAQSDFEAAVSEYERECR